MTTTSDTKYSYRVRVLRSTPPELREIAISLGFAAGGSPPLAGRPSPAGIFDALAVAYREDGARVCSILADLLGRDLVEQEGSA